MSDQIEIPEDEEVPLDLSDSHAAALTFAENFDGSGLLPDGSMPPMRNYGSSTFFAEYFESEKTFIKLVKKVVQYCRRSPEYRRYTKFLTENMDLGRCFLSANLDDEEAKRGGLEIHHYPLTIFDICEIVTLAKYIKKEHFTLFSIANEVMRLHYQNRVGLVPLLETYHQAAHAGTLYIPPAVVFGKWLTFLEEYKDFLQEKHIDKLGAIKEMLGNEDYHLRRLELMTKVNPVRWIDRGDDLGKLLLTADQTATEVVQAAAEDDALDTFFEEPSDTNN